MKNFGRSIGFVKLRMHSAGLLLATLATLATMAQQPPLVPREAQLAPYVERALEAGFLTEEERIDLRVFHGVWEESDLDSPDRRARAALLISDFDDPVWEAPDAPVEARAEMLLRSGRISEALERLEGAASPHAVRLRSECFEWLGRFEEADAALDPVIDAGRQGELTSPAERVEYARALIRRAQLRGEPASNFRRILQILGEIHQRDDRLYWPAKLIEGSLLLEKDNAQEAAQAFHETLSLNPRCSEAWYGLGRIALDRFDFESALRAVEELRNMNPDHLLAGLLAAETDLMQNLPDEAEVDVEAVLATMPRQRQALALRAAVWAIRYDIDGAMNALDDLDELSPNHPWGYYTVGYHLSRNRQYDAARPILEEAIRRQPAWPAPMIELGLMALQAGDDGLALRTLREAKTVDPFNVRAAFSLFLVEDLQMYETVSSEHFTIRFSPDEPDRILAPEMLEPLEQIHRDVSAAFRHEPDRKTLIELMPSHERFAVRITGVPAIHTIAACTGPVIAMESPREGPGHTGVYDWRRVIRHEYVHTITLDLTANRIPHWFTEAAAVWQELAPRDYETCQQLASSLDNGTLFTLDEINWAFVRPRRPGDRGKAYAQGHWMFEFLVETYGREPMLKLMSEYRLGLPEDVAMPSALGVSRGEFYTRFLEWAGDQVRRWGLAPEPTIAELVTRIDTESEDQAAADEGAPVVDEDQIDAWLAEYPDHPELLQLKIDVMERKGLGDERAMIELLDRYRRARPVDPMPYRRLAQIHRDAGRHAEAIPSLEQLDRWEQDSGAIAIELARQYRATGDYKRALGRAERALSIEPFNAPYRELAAAIAIQAKAFDAARRHIEALTIIEPDRPLHQRRLEALERLVDEG